MCSFKVFVMLAVVGYAMGAPKPIDLEKIGRSLSNFGQKAIPAVKGACGFFNGYFGYPAYPQGQGYPQIPVYYQPRYYPQYPQNTPNFPQYPQNTPNFPQYPGGFPQNTPSSVPTAPSSPPTEGQNPSGGATEVDDLNNGLPDANFVIPQDIPPQIQDVFRNFNSLPTVKGPVVNSDEENTIKTD